MSKRDKLFDLPIYKKAELILDLVNSLLNTISEEDEYLSATKYMMRDDASIICAKIAVLKEVICIVFVCKMPL